MKPDMEQKLEQLAKAIDRRDSFVDDVMSRIKNSPVQLGKKTKPKIVFRRILMKSPLTLTAAAAILIAAGLFMHLQNIPFDGAAKAYAMSDVPEIFHSAKTLHIKGRLFFDHDDAEPAEIEHWVDIENTRWHSVQPNYSIIGDEFDCYLTEEIFDGIDLKVCIDHRKQKYTYYTLSALQKNLMTHQMIVTSLQLICGQPEFFDICTIKGTDVIDGHTYNLWEGLVDTGPMKFKMHSWLSPKTGQMAKAVIWRTENSEAWNKACEFDTVEWNIPFDESIFSLEGPDGYKATNTVETPVKATEGKMIGGLGVVNLEEYFLFALPDNCLVMCWRNEFNKELQAEHQYFNDLFFGGPLPQLPAEVYALKTDIEGQGYLWQGRHLTYTQKDGKFYEWALYVPEQTPPTKPGHTYGFTLVYRMNVDQKANVTLSTGPDITIKNQADFEKLVMEAIRAMSDDPATPASFTLEQVLSLIPEKE